jgi:hypothetical protein
MRYPRSETLELAQGDFFFGHRTTLEIVNIFGNRRAFAAACVPRGFLTHRNRAVQVGHDDDGMRCGARLPAGKAFGAWDEMGRNGTITGFSSIRTVV